MTRLSRHQIAYRLILPYAAATLVIDGGVIVLALKFISIVGYALLAYELSGPKNKHLAASAASSKDFMMSMLLVYSLTIGVHPQHEVASQLIPSVIVRELRS